MRRRRAALARAPELVLLFELDKTPERWAAMFLDQLPGAARSVA